MKRIKIAITAGAFVLAIAGALVTRANEKVFSGEVDYKPDAAPCQQHPECKTTNLGISCSNTFIQGTNCQTAVASRLPL